MQANRPRCPAALRQREDKLIAVCDRAASGDLAGAKRVAIDVCHDIIGALPEFVRTQAQVACPTA